MSAFYGDSSVAFGYLIEPGVPRRFIDATISTSAAAVYSDETNLGSETFFAPAALADAWHCLEWRFLLVPMGRMVLRVDGELLVNSGNIDLTVNGGFDSVFIGQGLPPTGIPGDSFYFDQLVIARTRRVLGRTKLVGADVPIGPAGGAIDVIRVQSAQVGARVD